MSLHVYISREAFKEAPISIKEWINAARQCDDLLVEEQKNKRGIILNTVRLKSDKNQHLSLTPYGLVHAQNPSKELIEAMFKLAPALGSRVYSERLKPYASVKDWEGRTKSYRERREERIREYQRGWYKRKVFWVILAAILGVVVGLITS